MKTKTIKDLAEELGVSKETIRRCVATLPPHCYHTGANNQRLINAEGIKKIREKVERKVVPQNRHIATTQNELVVSYQNQIKSLQEQLLEKDNQINQLHTMLHSQQQLSLLDKQAIEKLQIEVTELKEPKQEVKKSFWKIFG